MIKFGRLFSFEKRYLKDQLNFGRFSIYGLLRFEAAADQTMTSFW